MSLPRPRRRWLRISLGGALLLITGICLLLGWQADRVARQRRAVEMVERLGGRVYFAHQRSPDLPSWHDPQVATPGPRWLHSLVGEEWFCTPERAEIVDWDGRAEHTDLEKLCGLKSLKALDLFKMPITDEDVTIVAGLGQLEELRLYGADVSDAALKELASLRHLRYLTIGNTSAATLKLSDQGLSYLVRLPRLEHLSLGKTCITADGLEQVAMLTELRSLEIRLPSETEVRPACLKWLHKLTDLTLHGASLTEETCKALATDKLFRNLTLVHCRISDSGLGRLVGLIALDLQCTPVSATALKNLTELGILRLSQIDVDVAMIDSLRAMPELFYLRIADCSIDRGAISRLAPLTQLSVLYISSSSIRDDDLIGIGQLTGLTDLHLESTQITDAGLSRLTVPSTATVYLYLKGNVSEAAAEQFRSRTGATVDIDPTATISSDSQAQGLP